MRHKKTVAIILPLLLFASTSFKCNGGGAPEAQRKYGQALDDLDATISAMFGKKRLLAQQGKITPAEELRLTNSLSKASESVAAARRTVHSITSTDARDKATIARLLPVLSASLEGLNEDILSIQDSSPRSEFRPELQNIRASLDLITKLTSSFTADCEDLGGGCFRCSGDPCKYCPNVPPDCPRQ
jgi:hypothetical protein